MNVFYISRHKSHAKSHVYNDPVFCQCIFHNLTNTRTTHMKFKMKIMKPNFKTFPHFHVLARTFLATVAVLALSAAHVFAGSEDSIPAAILKNLDAQIVM